MHGVSRHQQEHAEEFAAFVRADGPRLLRFATAIAGPSAAEDALQAALTNTFVRWGSVRDRDPGAYVRRAVVNGTTSVWRRDRRLQPLPAHHDRADSADRFGQQDDREQLLAGLRQLPGRRRAVLVLRYLEGWDDTAIAVALDVRPATVRSAAARGLTQLRGLLGEDPLGAPAGPIIRPEGGAHHA